MGVRVLLNFWSAVTCHRFGFWATCRPVLKVESDLPGRDRSRPPKAVTGHRTPKIAPIAKDLRIAFATPEYVTEHYFDGGLANYLHRIAVALADLGHDVHVLTQSQIEESQFQHHGVTVHRVMLGKSWRVANLVSAYRLATVVYSLNLSTQVYRKLRGLHAERAFDIVQFPNYSYCGLLSILFLRVPHVLRASSEEPFFHDAAKERSLNFKLLTLLERLQFQRSPHVFTPSRGLQEIIDKKYGKPDTKVIPSPMYLEASESDASIYEQQFRNVEYLLFFGRFERRKGFEILVPALAKALALNKDVQAVLIGRDVTTKSVPSMAEYARSLCKEFGSRFRVLDRLSHSQLYPIISKAKFVVLPSVSDNLPNACLEAMALGKAVIGTRDTTLAELIVDEETGFLVPPADVAALADKIEYAWRHPNLNEIGEAAQRKMQDFAREITANALLSYYHDSLNGANP
jgi:glycosyltransferase involved in cell wall biosynthesis